MKILDLAEFQEFGYLQEVNRRFFHTLGLALSVYKEEGQEPRLVVLDGRDDPDGFVFTSLCDIEDAQRSANISEEWERRAERRYRRFDWTIQPLLTEVEDDLHHA